MRVRTIGNVEADFRRQLDARLANKDVEAKTGGDCLFLWETDLDSAITAIDGGDDLAWVHMRNAGVPPALLAACGRRGLTLTNGSGAHGDAIAEYVVCALLALTKRLPELGAQQRQGEWRPDIKVSELRGRRIGIVGTGALGQGCARLLRAFNVEIIGFNRSGDPAVGFDDTYASTYLGSELPDLDALVIAAPLTDQTRNLVGRRELGRLPRHAVVINVGRGEILDEEALVSALKAGDLAGAALDVFRQEPLPPKSAIWSAPNLIVTPHNVDDTRQTTERGLSIFFDNLDRWLNSTTLRNIVRVDLGY